jgi:hypothetical protein
MSEPIVPDRPSVPTYDTDVVEVASKKPRGWRRAVRITGKLVLGVLGLVLVLVIFLHTSWGKSFVRGRIESKLNAMTTGSVTLGELDYGLPVQQHRARQARDPRRAGQAGDQGRADRARSRPRRAARRQPEDRRARDHRRRRRAGQARGTAPRT